MIVTNRQRSGEGNVFSRVCHFVCLHFVLSTVGIRLKYFIVNNTTGSVHVPNQRYGCSVCTIVTIN